MSTIQVTDLMLRKSQDTIDEHGQQRCSMADCRETFPPTLGKRWHSDSCGSRYRLARSHARAGVEISAVALDVERYAAFEPQSIDELAPFETVAGARMYLDEHADVGAHCPCCGQRVQRYRRPIAAPSAAMLVLADTQYGIEEFHQPTLERLAGFAAGDWAKLRYWGLIEEMRSLHERDDLPRAGWWFVTERGHRFANREVRVRQYAVIFDSELLRLEGDLVSIDEALGQRFDYGEVVQRGQAQAATGTT